MKKLVTLIFLILMTGVAFADSQPTQPAWLNYYAGVMPVRNSFPVSTITSGASTFVRFKTFATTKTGGLK